MGCSGQAKKSNFLGTLLLINLLTYVTVTTSQRELRVKKNNGPVKRTNTGVYFAWSMAEVAHFSSSITRHGIVVSFLH